VVAVESAGLDSLRRRVELVSQEAPDHGLGDDLGQKDFPARVVLTRKIFAEDRLDRLMANKDLQGL